MRKIGILTSGGDAPGMNPCIRAVVRYAISRGMEVIGIKRGYKGLIDGDAEIMNMRTVSGIIYRGGTILKTARSKYFTEEEGQRKAVQNIKKFGIEALIVVGGDGSFRGARILDEKWDVPTIGVPATIDNDIWGTDFTIGFLTAVNTALDAIDKIRDTAVSHDRVFFVEVMGRTSGFIALWSGIAGGAEEILIPEVPVDIDGICERLERGRKRGKVSSIIIVAEGGKAGSSYEIASKVREKTGYDDRVVVLGHLQRGGSPCAWDRILGTMLGKAAVDVAIDGGRGVAVGIINGKVKTSSLKDAYEKKKKIDFDLYHLNEIMAT